MRTTSCNKSGDDSTGRPIIAIKADYSKFDSAKDILRDAADWGLLEEMRDLICEGCQPYYFDNVRMVRDIAYEFAGSKNRDFAVDLFIHLTGIAEFGPSSLRDYAGKHGCCHEWFRKEAEAMRKRLNLPPLPSLPLRRVA
jgi:hypothetical protein